jgi:ribosomal protein S21
MKKDMNKDELINSFLRGEQMSVKKGGDISRTNMNYLDDSYLNSFQPLEVKVYGHNFDKAFKAFRAIVQKERILSLYKQKQSFEKPSVKLRRKRNEMQQKRLELEAKRQKILSGEFERELLKKQKLKELKKKIKEVRTTRTGTAE